MELDPHATDTFCMKALCLAARSGSRNRVDERFGVAVELVEDPLLKQNLDKFIADNIVLLLSYNKD